MDDGNTMGGGNPMGNPLGDSDPMGGHKLGGGENLFRDSFDPYQAPPSAPPGAYAAGPLAVPGGGKVSQIRIVAILSIVQGGLECAYGLMLVVMAVVMPQVFKAAAQENPAGPPPELMSWIMFGIYGVMGGVALLVGGLRILAGIRNLQFRSRTLGIVSLALGMVNLMNCYCLPTGVALLVYGLIVYLSPEVAAAFQMRDSGDSVETILQRFQQPGGWTPPPKQL